MASTTYHDIAAAVAALQARTDAAGDPVPDVSGEELRLYAALFSAGVVQSDAYQVVPGAGLSVDVGTNPQEDLAIVPGTLAGQGNYLVRIGGGAPETLALNAAHLSNPRIDQVYIAINDDAYDAGGITMARLAVRTGDPAASPAEPGPDAGWTAYLLLATVLVGAGATSVAPGDITDERTIAGLVTGGLVPPGTMVQYLGSVAPSGWLFCRGQAISRTAFPALFAAIGTTYGPGDGSTTFNLPNMERRMPIGKAASGSASALGQTGGAFDHVHSGPSHTHSGPSHTHSGPSHTHGYSSTSGSGGSHDHGAPDILAEGAHTHSFSDTSSTPSSTHVAGSFTGAAVGVPTSTHTHSVSGTTGSGGSHIHSMSNNHRTSTASSHTHSVSGTTGSGGTGNTGASGTAATGASGTGDTGTANPPYLVVNYIVKV